MADTDASRGVQALIDRLREQGVEAGRIEAGQILEQARAEAEAIREAARVEARQTREEAAREAEALRRAATDAIRLAGRDAVLALRAALSERFIERVRSLVRVELADPAVLQALVLAVGGRAGEAVGERDVVIRLPAHAPTYDEVRRDPDGLARDPLSELVSRLSAGVLREGVTLESGGHGAGLVVRIAEAGVELDLTDEAVADMLLRHLHPRFRALLDGVVGGS